MLGDADLIRRIFTNKNIGEYYICSLQVTSEKGITFNNILFIFLFFFFHPEDVVRLMKILSQLFFSSPPCVVQSIEELEQEMLNGQKLQGPQTSAEVYRILKQKGMLEK